MNVFIANLFSVLILTTTIEIWAFSLASVCIVVDGLGVPVLSMPFAIHPPFVRMSHSQDGTVPFVTHIMPVSISR